MNKDEKRYVEEIKIFSKKIKSLRETKGMIQLDLADKMGMDRSEISKIENEKKNIEFFTMLNWQ
ncbi:helix-turn-helix protein [Sediminibacterium magnilacihabitans]|nr:helix-turn-helix protein [Sediminibacterium magnilacihabitans]